jgi:hypothetical protein
MPKKGNFL